MKKENRYSAYQSATYTKILIMLQVGKTNAIQDRKLKLLQEAGCRAKNRHFLGTRCLGMTLLAHSSKEQITFKIVNKFK